MWSEMPLVRPWTTDDTAERKKRGQWPETEAVFVTRVDFVVWFRANPKRVLTIELKTSSTAEKAVKALDRTDERQKISERVRLLQELGFKPEPWGLAVGADGRSKWVEIPLLRGTDSAELSGTASR